MLSWASGTVHKCFPCMCAELHQCTPQERESNGCCTSACTRLRESACMQSSVPSSCMLALLTCAEHCCQLMLAQAYKRPRHGELNTSMSALGRGNVIVVLAILIASHPATADPAHHRACQQTRRSPASALSNRPGPLVLFDQPPRAAAQRSPPHRRIRRPRISPVTAAPTG